MHKSQSLINHVALVLDASSSMLNHKDKLVQVADEQIRHLALRSEELSQETRVSIYTFADRTECLIFDMDVMRLPSIRDLYRVGGMTALIDATVKSQVDLDTTSQLYGDHAFLTFVLTDGGENASRLRWPELAKYTANKPGWHIGFLVPNSNGIAYLERCGVNRNNISIWDASSVQGLADSFSVIRNATDTFMSNRASGITSSGVFGTGADKVNAKTVKILKPELGYKKFNVPYDGRIDAFVNSLGYRYVPGMAFYELTKTETIQPQKKILVVDKKSSKVYGGDEARNLIGLPNYNVRVKPDHNPDYEIYVQSTSMNRKLRANTHVLVRK